MVLQLDTVQSTSKRGDDDSDPEEERDFINNNTEI